MKHLSLLMKPASSLCNMHCAYCFYEDISIRRETASYGIMGTDAVVRMMENVFKDLEEGDELTLAFQGGEPTLAGLGWFENLVSILPPRERKIKINYALQTNGLLIDDSWAEFLHRHHFLTGLSLDALEKLHNANRQTARGEGTWEACLKAKALLEKHRVEYNILSVLTNDLAAEPEKVWNFITREHIRFIQFIPCLEELGENKPPSSRSLRPARFASFYTRLYSRWMKELERGSYISIKLFDDTAIFFFKGIPSACGINGRCHIQYVVEADGSVYPCDFYVLERYCGGKLTEHTLRELFDSPVMQSFLEEERELPELCRSCPYFKSCGGGCKRMQNTMYFGSPEAGFSGAAGPVCGYRIFLERCLKSLEHTVRRHFGGLPGKNGHV